MAAPSLLFQVEHQDGETRLTIGGEIDNTTAQALEERATSLLSSRPSVLVLDFSGVVFCDSSGIAAILRTYNKALPRGTRLSIEHTSPHVRKVFEVVGLTRLLATQP